MTAYIIADIEVLDAAACEEYRHPVEDGIWRIARDANLLTIVQQERRS